MNLNECMSCIRNLEGIFDFHGCLFYAGELLECLPNSFFIVNSLKNNENINEFDNQFYRDHPWEIPLELSFLEKRQLPYISVFDFIGLKNEPLVIDIRTIQEFKICLFSLY